VLRVLSLKGPLFSLFDADLLAVFLFGDFFIGDLSVLIGDLSKVFILAISFSLAARSELQTLQVESYIFFVDLA